MKEFFFCSLLILFIYLLLRVLLSMEARVINKIKKDAARKNRVVKKIRNPEERDGNSPFSNFRISMGSSHIFGFSGERRYIKIVEAEENGHMQKNWVKVDTTFFIPSNVEWKKVS